MAAANNNNQQPPIEPEPMAQGYESDPDEPVPLEMCLPPELEEPVAWQMWDVETPIERPDWLPNDWGMELARSARGPRYRFYYTAPSGKLMRSENEVLRFLAQQIQAAQPEEEAPVTGRGRWRGRGRRARRGRG